MNQLIAFAKTLFEKIKPFLMSDENKPVDATLKDPENESITASAEEPSAEPVEEITPVENIVKADVAVQVTEASTATPLQIITAVANGAGIGLLLGMLLGLAVSPVVSGIIGVLSGMLAVLLGLDDKFLSPLKSIRIGAFGFFCVAGIVMGMYIRTNNGLLPSREKMMQQYTKVGFSKQEALDFIAYREFNLIPSSWKGGAAGEATSSSVDSDSTGEEDGSDEAGEGAAITSSSSAKQSTGHQFADPNENGAARKNVLYSSEIDASQCYILDMTSSEKPVAQIKNTFEQAGGTWKELADKLGTGLPESVYLEALFDLRDIFCEEGKGGVLKIPKNAAVDKLNSTQSLSEIKKTLVAAAPIWNTIVNKLSADISEGNQKTLFLSLAKILGHE
ncbi:MAG: hypothetical protein IPO83_15080 [Chitinophagaceae bacterium]|nr:hypothetical protein [Chitinophagaceae bacterium]